MPVAEQEGRCVAVQVDGSPTIDDGKRKVAGEEGVAPHHVPRLLFAAVELEDTTVSGVGSQSTVQLVPQQEGVMQLFVKTDAPKRKLLFEVAADRCTLRSVKLSVAGSIGVPHEDLVVLTADGTLIPDEWRTLAAIQGVRHEGTLLAVQRAAYNKKLVIRTLTGMNMMFHYNPNDTVLDLKLMLAERSGIPPDQQRLIFTPFHLEPNEATLATFNIQQDSVVHLLLRLRGGMYTEASGRSDFTVPPPPKATSAAGAVGSTIVPASATRRTPQKAPPVKARRRSHRVRSRSPSLESCDDSDAGPPPPPAVRARRPKRR